MTEVEMFERHVTERYGLMPRELWSTELGQALSEEGARTGLGPREIVMRALGDEAMALRLVRHLTVGETHFLRCAPHFEALARHMGARVVQLGSGERVQVLSAGCATGEEPYSVAIAVSAYLGPAALARLSVTGIDLDVQAVEHARQARYRPWSFRGAPPWLLARYTRGCNGYQEVLPEVRRPVRFEVANILDHLAAGQRDSLDAVLFRNVGIYLSPEALRRIFVEIARVLRPGGLLAVAPSDPRPQEPTLPSLGDPTTSLYAHDPAGTRVAPAVVAPPRRGVQAAPAPTPRSRPAVRPARALRKVAPSRQPPEPPEPDAPALSLTEIRQLADCGEREAAERAAQRWCTRESDAPAPCLLLGQLFLEASRLDEALVALRRAVFLGSGDPIARFWYASGLHAAGRLNDARRQLGVTRKLLVDYPHEELLSDGETRARDLAEAARFLEEGMR